MLITECLYVENYSGNSVVSFIFSMEKREVTSLMAEDAIRRL